MTANNKTRKRATRRQPSSKVTPATMAQQMVQSLYAPDDGETVHKIVERQGAAFEQLLKSVSGGGEERRLRELCALEDKLRAALPPALHKDFVEYSDMKTADMTDYLEAGYLIGLAVRAQFGGTR